MADGPETMQSGWKLSDAEVVPVIQARAIATAEVDVRYSFTAQYLMGSALFARRCAEIERAHPDNPDEATRTEHMALVTAAIMQCAAAVEAESGELTIHGPGSHLGSDRMDRKAAQVLAPLTEFIDDQDALSRFKIILHILNRPPMSEGEQPWQDMETVVKLRNELIHYKSKWGKEMERQKFFKTLQHLRLTRPPFVHPNSNFFPHQLLGAACAAWVVRTAVAFLNCFYDRMGIESRLKPYMALFDGL
jgi:hypothetical protein